MYIKEIYIGDFAGSSDKKYTLSDGVNLLEGANEAGKSTLCAFIKFIFFGLEAKTKPLPERKRYMPHGKTSVWGNIIVNAGGRDYLVSRTLSMTGKTACTDIYKITDVITGEEYMPGVEPGDALLNMNSAVFERTAYVSQKLGASVNSAEVAKAMENLLFSAEETTDSARALKDIDKARADILYKNGKGGRLYEARSRRDEVALALSEAKGARAERDGISSALDEQKRKLASNDESTKKAEELLEKYDAATALLAFGRADELKEKISEGQKRQAALEERGVATPEQIQSIMHLSSDMRTALGALESAKEKLSSLPPESERTFEGKDAAKSMADALSKKKRYGTALLTLGIILIILGIAAAGALYALDMVRYALFALPFAAAGVVLIIIGALSRKKASDAFATYGVRDAEALYELAAKQESNHILHEKEKSERVQKLAQAQSVYESKERQAKEICEKYGRADSSSESLEELCAALATLREKYSECLSEIKTNKELLARECEHTEGEDRDELVKKLKGAEPELFIKEHDRREISAQASAGRVLSQRLSEGCARLERELIECTGRARREKELSEELEVLEGEISRLQRRYDALMLAYDVLDRAAANIKEHVSPALARRAGELMSSATACKYSTLWVSDELSLSYADSSRGGEKFDSEFMSRGTADLAYVCLRVALCELLSGEEVIPMIFDESFSALDDNRLRETFAVISARGGQSIVLTSQKRDKELLKDGNYIKL